MQQVKDFQDFKQTLQSDENLQKAFQQDPKAAIEKISDGSFIPDNWIYRIVVGSLGLVIVIITFGIVWRVAFGEDMEEKSVPTILTAMGSAAIGALAGLLAPSPNRG